MKPAAFTEDAPGEVVEEGGHVAFRPDPLPPELDVSGELAMQLADASRALGALAGFGRRLENPARFRRLFHRLEAVRSVQMEGSAVTVSDVYAYEAGEESVVPERERTAATAATQTARALEEGLTALADGELSLDLLRDAHGTMLADTEDETAGVFRSAESSLEHSAQARYVPPVAEHVGPAMAELETFLQNGGDWHPLVAVALAHYQFQAIRPFSAGNDRMTRLLTVLLLREQGLPGESLLAPSAYFDSHQEPYRERLFDVSTRGAWREWVLFFLEGIETQAETALERLSRLVGLQESYRETYGAYRSGTILELVEELFETPVISVSEAAERLDVTTPTANSAVNELESEGVLTEMTGQDRYRVFRAGEILDAVAGEVDSSGAAADERDSDTADDEDARQSGLTEFQ